MKQDHDTINIEETVDKLLSYVPHFTVEELEVMTEVCAQWCLNGSAEVDGKR